jgi:cytoskeletal protein CcmA (bactofilin family)
MPSKPAITSADTIRIACPRCGYAQSEPRLAYSTICKNCQQHFRIQEALHPTAKAAKVTIEQRKVRCFQCGTELEAPKAAASTMCKRCSGHVDLSDYRIATTVSKNFRTHGWLVVEEKGYLLNTESRVGDAVLKGRIIGKLVTSGALEIHTSANIKGQFSAGRLVIPAGERFRWPEELRVGAADIGGELAANLRSEGTVVLRSTARFFGDVTAANMVVEAGAVFVGNASIGTSSNEVAGAPNPKPTIVEAIAAPTANSEEPPKTASATRPRRPVATPRDAR